MMLAMILALTAPQAAPPQQLSIDWPALPALPYRAPPLVTEEMNTFVKNEVIARKCPVPAGDTLVAEVAVLVDPQGNIDKAVPRAIDCPTVEQYAAGTVGGFARNNLMPRVATTDQWYKTSLTFSWKK